jgi:ElaB/YqjD/DUF883 family membrane-anchored ribosome-binding protein
MITSASNNSVNLARDGMPAVKKAADDMLRTAGSTVDATRDYANTALDKAEDKVRELRGNVDPLVDRFSAKAQQLARQSLDMAAEATEMAQKSLSRYTAATSQYVAAQPVRSVLIAAGVGAAIALLVSSARNRNRY